MDHIIKKHQQGKQKKRYFTKETEQAIIDYNNSTDPDERSKIYSKYIHWPFFKLTQNIIHTFKFYHTEVENLEHLQHEIMVFLLKKIHLFNPENGAKAYSYFGTIVKRWLINYNNKNYKKKINNIPLSELNDHSNQEIENSTYVSSPKKEKELEFLIEGEFETDELGIRGYKHNDKLSYFIDQYIDYITENIYNFFPKNNDAQIADAVLELFRKRENIDIFNKKALYIYIREIIDVKTPKITKITKKLYQIFQKKYDFYLMYGYFNSNY